jgi:phosphatidylinositol-3-phosphatase
VRQGTKTFSACRRLVLVGVLACVVTGCTTSPHVTSADSRRIDPRSSTPGSPTGAPTSPGTLSSSPVPRFDHIVVVIMENRSSDQIIGNTQAPFLTAAAQQGVVLTQSFAVTHPSQPNYLALFSGSSQRVSDDSCPHALSGPNLASALMAAGESFVGYSESLPHPGYVGCSSGSYARKHNPWVNFANLPATINQPFTSFTSDYSKLPTVAFVIPNLEHDMHDGSVSQADQWMSANLGAYLVWAQTHESLLIVTWDENDGSAGNQIPTILAGADLMSGTDGQRIDHYGLLRMIEDSCGIAPVGASAAAAPLLGTWQP